ncbi:extracellular solute-binding protein [Catellatospora sp. KI3]|uniref:extracellular solute-binding protein n=1 Tax=Catellatospora sp. KI3 TaxID=3041620 RepID=UPI0024827CC1|nr:extracellular solute-binding protein [Catellatospora sp. KI3]MDI1461140.1 extracellular solute-binding protein [Catellatospora sp. KI3]
MSQPHSRRNFLMGAISSSALTAAALYFMPGGRPLVPAGLTLWTGADSTGGRQLLFDMWNKANPDAPVKVETDPGRTGDQKQRMINAAVDGTADILNLDIIDIPEFAAAGLISPLTLNENLFLKGILRPGAVDGEKNRFWAAPFNTDVGMVFERVPAGAAAAERPDLPQILDSLVRPGSLGFVGQVGPGSSASDEAFTVNVLEHVISRNPDLLTRSTKFTDPDIPLYEVARWQQALAPLRAAIGDRRVLLADDEPTSVDAFIGRPGPRFMRNWPVAYRDLMERGDQDVRQGRIKVHPFPTAILGGQSLAVAANSSHKAQAVRLIEFLTSDEAQKVLATHGLAPTRVAAYTDPHLKVAISHLETMRQAVENARIRPVHRNYAAFTRAVATHIRPVLAGPEPLPSAFVDDIRTALTEPA